METSSKQWQKLTGREWARVSVVTLSLSALLTTGFIPTAKGFAIWVTQALHLTLSPTQAELLGQLSFPLLALFFYLSLPRKVRAEDHAEGLPGKNGFWDWIWIPALISFLYGRFHHYPSIFSLISTTSGRLSLTWTFFAIPCGEELLFRGWFYAIVNRIWPRSLVSATGPMPLCLWASAVAFSLWHLQNLGTDPMAAVAFQCLYTLFTGLWLGYLRWKTGKLTVPIMAHFVLNAVTNLP